MTFVSLKFLIFIAVFLVAYKLAEKKKTVCNLIIVAGNYVFYSMAGLPFATILLAISVFTWFIAGLVFDKKSKPLMALGIVVNASVLIFFKYFGLVFGSVAFKIIMPLGISMYIFEAISYIADSYTGKLTRRYSLIDALIYLGFFPTITSGPIMKSYEFLPQIESVRPVTRERFEAGIQRIALGVFMKVALADRLSVAVSSVYSAPSAYSGLTLLWTSITYTLQLYFDFAGYSHMAIGIAAILGFDIKENFNMPFLATSISEFWRRWHMSLTSWITEYIYFPLGGSRRGKLRTYRNVFLAMLLSGMWHGSTLNFLVWGAAHGIAQVLHQMFGKKEQPLKNNKVITVISMMFTFLLFNFLQIPFWWSDLRMAGVVLSRIFTFKPGISYFYIYTAIYGCGLLAAEIYAALKNNREYPFKPMDLSTFRGKIVLITIVMLTLCFAYFGNSAFIYGAMF